MNTLLALIVAIISGFLADYVLTRLRVPDPAKVLVAFLFGVLVFLVLNAKPLI